MKTYKHLIYVASIGILTTLQSTAQIAKGIAFGLKGGVNQNSTTITKKPKNHIVNLGGVGVDRGFQVGGWATIRLSRWLFLDNDLHFLRRSNRYEDQFHKEIVYAINNYNYLGLGSRIGVTYKGIFASIGPELNLLLAKKVAGGSEAPALEWGINGRLGYQYKRIRAEVFYSRSLSPYEKKTWNFTPTENVYSLFMSRSIGVSVGIMLFKSKKNR
ncbi:hypothetical protein [Runella zeae]|uniref:hypothetical protein n=1 Tax=Runella zeae TaxID=94255 RepID=UPI0003F5AD7A|nr:hypothetical protein [Runella zeae]